MEPLVVLNRLLEQARKEGARGAEALLTDTDEVSVTLHHGQLQTPPPQSRVSLRLRLYMEGGRLGADGVDAPSQEAIRPKIDALVERCLARAADAPEDPFEGPADRFDLEALGLSLNDRRHGSIRPADRRELVRENAENCARLDPDIRVEGVRYQESLTQRSFANTRGASGQEMSTTFHGVATARFGSRPRIFTNEVTSRHFANVASIPFGMELGRRLVTLHNPASLPTGAQAIILPPHTMAVLLRAMAPAFNAAAVRQGATFVARHLGKAIADTRLHVLDDPGLPGALATRAFDDHGVPPAPVVLIKEGVAAGLYFDPHTARASNVRPTGHVMEGQTRPSNLIMRAGTRSRNAIGMELGDYLEIENLHATEPLDLTTGLLKTQMDILVWVKNEIVGAVQGLPLQMPLRSLLMGIEEIASDQVRLANVDASSAVIQGLKLHLA